MLTKTPHRCVTLGVLCLAMCATFQAQNRPMDTNPADWKIHDVDRPQPPIVDPGKASTKQPTPPSSDAIILFEGKDLSKWISGTGAAARWKVKKGYMEVVKGAGGISSRQGFGDCQLHVEWRTPVPANGEGQERGNSGVFLMGRYELQVLDSYQNKTYPDGQAAAIYGQYPPLVNASRPPGRWQTYDIFFRRPRFDSSGKLLHPARMTVLHNGVLVQDNAVLTGPTAHKERPPYTQHADRLPVSLQDHGDPVRYRNIWLRELPEDK
jgi:3-keto-disaccharide hydrolase